MNERVILSLVVVFVALVFFLAAYAFDWWASGGRPAAMYSVSAAGATLEKLDEIIRLLKEIKHKMSPYISFHPPVHPIFVGNR